MPVLQRCKEMPGETLPKSQTLLTVVNPGLLSQLNGSAVTKSQGQVSSQQPAVITTSQGLRIITTCSATLLNGQPGGGTSLPAFAQILSTQSPVSLTKVVPSLLAVTSPKPTNSPKSASTTAVPVTATSLTGLVKYPEIRPLIKEEPVDSSYECMDKQYRTQASSEALGNLKSVISSRIGSFQGQRPNLQKNMPTHKLSPAPGVSSPVQVQVLPGGRGIANHRLVPVGPPVPIPNMHFAQVKIPGLPIHGYVPMTSNVPGLSTTGSNSAVPSQAGSDSAPARATPSDQMGTKGGPVVVNAKSVGAPKNGQLLTLPQAVVKRLTLNKALALKINNKQINVPPSGFFPCSEGLKVFLPPNTFPNETLSVSVSDDVKSPEDSSGQKLESQTTNEQPVSTEASKGERDIRKSKHYPKCCLMQKLYMGYDAMEHIFKYLALKDLLK